MMPRNAMVFGEVPDAATPAAISRWLPQERRRASGLAHDPEQYLDERRLACAVRTQQTEDRSAFDAKRHTFQCLNLPPSKETVAVGLSQVLYIDHRVCHENRRPFFVERI